MCSSLALSQVGSRPGSFLGAWGTAVITTFVLLVMPVALLRVASAAQLDLTTTGIVNPLSSDADRTIRIGTPLGFHTGKARSLYRAYKLFFDRLNQKRGGIRLFGKIMKAELLVIDDKNDKTIVADVASHLIDNLGVKLLLGPYGSTLTRPVAQVAHDKGAVMVAPASSVTSVFAGKPNIFGTLASSAQALGPAFHAMKEQIASINIQNNVTNPAPVTVAFFQEDKSFTKQVCGGVAGYASATGMRFLAEASSTVANVGNIADTVSALKLAQPDIVVACVYDDFCQAFLQEASRQEFSPKAVLSTICVTSSGFLDQLGDKARWVIGVAPWTSRLNLYSDFFRASRDSGPNSIYTSADFVHDFTDTYGLTPIYQAASAWAAAAVLVTAIEQANSTEPNAVAAQLRSPNFFRTIFGTVSFNSDGQSLNPWKALQFHADGSQEHLVSGSDTERPLFYPMPAWSLRLCYSESPTHSIWGFRAPGNCTRCSDTQVGNFSLETQKRSCKDCPVGRVSRSLNDCVDCRVCALLCTTPPGSVPVQGRCTQCIAGTFKRDGLCLACPTGRFVGMRGRTQCDFCDVGSMANSSGVSACAKCAAGFASGNVGSASCTPCAEGKFAAIPGETSCQLCRAGMIAPSEGLADCAPCPAGTRSAWGALTCLNCSVGEFQDQPRKTLCKSELRGTQCDRVGLVKCHNKQGYWITSTGVEPCIASPNACLANERCAKGHTGRQCLTCTPGHARRTDTCFQCPNVFLNAIFLIVSYVVCIVYILGLTTMVVRAASRPQDVHPILFKQFINHMVVFYVCAEIFTEVIKENKVVVDNELATDIGLIMLAPMQIIGDGMFQTESPVLSMNCLMQDLVHSLSWKDEVRIKYEIANHTMYSSIQDTSDLRDYHWWTEIGVAGFWLIWPVFLIIGGNIVGAYSLIRQLYSKEHIYDDAWKFYNDVYSRGFHVAKKNLVQTKWMLWVHEYGITIYQIWWPVRHLRAFLGQSKSRVIDWRAFAHESIPLCIAVLFCMYSSCLRGALRAQYCSSLGEGMGSVMVSASIIECYKFDSLILISIICGLVWGVALPAFYFCRISAVRHRLLDADVQHAWGFLINGYDFRCWWWEMVMFARKLTCITIMAISMNSEARVLLFLLSSVVCGVLHRAFDPYDRRANGLLNKMEWGHLVVWIIATIMILVAQTIKTPTLSILAPSLVFVMHFGYCAAIFWNMFVHVRASSAANISWQKIDDMPEGSFRQVFSAKLLAGHQKANRAASYIALDPQYGWVSVCGSRGDEAVPPYILKGRDASDLDNFRPRLSEAPMVPETADGERVLTANLFERLDLHKVLASGMKHVAEECGVFSASLLEFVIRATFVLARGDKSRQEELRSGTEEVDEHTLEAARRSRDPLFLLADGKHSGDAAGDKGGNVDEALQDAVTQAELMEEDMKTSHTQIFKVATHRKDVKVSGSHTADSMPTGTGRGGADGAGGNVSHSAAKQIVSDEMFQEADQDFEEFFEYEDSKGHVATEKETQRAEAEQLHQVREHRMGALVREMLMTGTFRHGLPLEDFQFSAMRLQRIPKEDLLVWVDLFEKQWIHKRATAMRSLMRDSGGSVEGSVQAARDGHENFATKSENMTSVEALLEKDAGQVMLNLNQRNAEAQVTDVQENSDPLHHVDLARLGDACLKSARGSKPSSARGRGGGAEDTPANLPDKGVELAWRWVRLALGANGGISTLKVSMLMPANRKRTAQARGDMEALLVMREERRRMAEQAHSLAKQELARLREEIEAAHSSNRRPSSLPPAPLPEASRQGASSSSLDTGIIDASQGMNGRYSGNDLYSGEGSVGTTSIGPSSLDPTPERADVGRVDPDGGGDSARKAPLSARGLSKLKGLAARLTPRTPREKSPRR